MSEAPRSDIISQVMIEFHGYLSPRVQLIVANIGPRSGALLIEVSLVATSPALVSGLRGGKKGDRSAVAQSLLQGWCRPLSGDRHSGQG